MPSRLPRLVATDLDGTLLSSDGTLSPFSAATLQALDARGIDVVFVTGRPPRWMTHLARHVGDHGLAVCSNGALLVDLHADRILHQTMLAPALLAELVEAASLRVAGLSFAVEYGWEFAAQPAYGAREPHVPADIAGLTSRPAAKLLVKHPQMPSDALLAEMVTAIGDRATCTHSGLGANLVEVSAPGTTKAGTLARLCADRGIDAADVAAFGDMPNDLAMLAWAGRPYAVAGGHPAVLAAVPTHVPDNDADGVARTLAALFDTGEPSVAR